MENMEAAKAVIEYWIDKGCFIEIKKPDSETHCVQLECLDSSIGDPRYIELRKVREEDGEVVTIMLWYMPDQPGWANEAAEALLAIAPLEEWKRYRYIKHYP